MSQNNRGGGLIIVSLIALACYCKPPEALTFHGKRLVGVPVRASKSLLQDEVRRAAEAYDLHPDLLTALVKVESGFNQEAVSPVGARGLSQVMPANAKRCGLKNADHLFDPVYNLRCGALILRQEIDRLGNLNDALTVYNCGRVDCSEGQKYAKKVIALSGIG